MPTHPCRPARLRVRASLALLVALAALATLAALAPRAALAQRGGAPSAPIASLDTAWGAISRTYWDTLFVEGTWRPAYDSIRATLRPGDDDEAVRRAIRALIAVPRQSHFALIPASAVPLPAPPRARARDARTPEGGGGPGTTGLVVRSIGDTVVAWRVTAGGSAARAGIRAGDIILALDSLPMDTVRARIAAGSGGDPAAIRQLVATFVLARLGGVVGDSVQVAVRDAAGVTQRRWLVREPITGRATQVGNLPPMVVSATRDSVGVGRGRYATVVTFSTWLPVISPDLDRYFFGARRASGMIIDLRGNPGGVVGMVAGISGHMLDTAIALGTMRGRGATIRFVANPRRVDPGGTLVGTFGGPIAILVDAFSASTSEFFAAGMQAIGRARIFGEQSAGMSLPALMSRLPNGDVLMHAIADHEDAAGRRVEGAGVVPDELVPLKRVDLRAGRDAPLEAARAWIAAQYP